MSVITETAERLAIVSVERIRAEFGRLMLSPAPRQGIGLSVCTGVVDAVLPGIAQPCETVDEHKRHEDVYEHTLTVIDQAVALEDPASKEGYGAYLLGGEFEGPDLTLRLTTLFHDVGKPRTRRFKKNGSVTFRVHDVVGTRIAAKQVMALRFNKQAKKGVARLVELRLRAFGLSETGRTDSTVRRFTRDAGDLLPRLIRLVRADVTSQNRRKTGRLRAGNDGLTARIRGLVGQEAFDAIRPDLDSIRIMEIPDLKSGPEVGAAYNYPPELRLDENPLGEEKAERYLLAWWSERSSSVKDSVPAAGFASGEP